MSQRLAGRGARLGAVLLDNLFVLLALVPGGVALMSAANSYGNDGMGAAFFLLVAGFIGVLGIQLYLLGKEGQTLGKRVVGIRIVDHSTGALAGAGRVLGLREFLRGIVSAIPYVGWVLILIDVLFIFSEDRRCIHDHIARTKVVSGAPAESTAAGASGTSRSVATDEPTGDPARTSVQGAADTTPGGHPDRTGDEPSPTVPSSIDRLRDVLRNLEELRDGGTHSEEKFQRSKRKALADVAEAADEDPEALLRGLRHLKDEGLLDATDVQTVKSIL